MSEADRHREALADLDARIQQARETKSGGLGRLLIARGGVLSSLRYAAEYLPKFRHKLESQQMNQQRTMERVRANMAEFAASVKPLPEATMYQKAVLKTAQGETVIEVTILQFPNARHGCPDVLLWGERIFQYEAHCADVPHYKECFAVAVVPFPGVDDNGFTVRQADAPAIVEDSQAAADMVAEGSPAPQLDNAFQY